jgi:hypothetical protein
MRIKHWQGYGSVNAKVVGRSLNTATGIRTLTINVWGNHEYGLVREDKYNINNWLVKKVAKVDIDYQQIEDIDWNTIPDIDDQEAIQYHIIYKEK